MVADGLGRERSTSASKLLNWCTNPSVAGESFFSVFLGAEIKKQETQSRRDLLLLDVHMRPFTREVDRYILSSLAFGSQYMRFRWFRFMQPVVGVVWIAKAFGACVLGSVATAALVCV